MQFQGEYMKRDPMFVEDDFNFVADGLVFPDRTPHPALFELKKLAQPVELKAVDLFSGRIRVINRKYFTSLADCELEWSHHIHAV